MSALGPLLYGIVFGVAIPTGLVLWARATADVVQLPALRSPLAGGALAVAGVVLWAAAVRELRLRGRGLPMNAFPPPEYVVSGPYRYLSHPIYLGAALVVVGVAVALGSASGLWLVAPVTILGMVAIVLGYERDDLRRRFGFELPRPRLALPPDSPAPATAWNRAAVYFGVLLPWLLVWTAVQLIGVPRDAFTLELPGEAAWPVLPWTEAVYASCYLLVLLTPLLLRSAAQLRRFALVGLVATALVGLIWVSVPIVGPARPAAQGSALGRLLVLERGWGAGMAALPAFHVLWALIAADALAARSRAWSTGAWVWAAAIAVSCITTGNHTVADVVAGIVAFPIVREYRAIWEVLRRATERIANSWREWRIGPVRFINHGVYAGIGGALVFWGVASLGRAIPAWILMGVVLCGLLGAGAFAQVAEHGSGLSRPFGYYGGVIGSVIGCFLAGLVGADPFLLLAGLSLAAPWTQAVGRLRCLVQGCCHGREASESIGIRYQHPRSRVAYLANMLGRPLHPTPLYSILSNIVLGVLLLRLAFVAAPLSLIVGIYLIGNGLARFVEEGYRGEPQTRQIAGLHIYQWLAIASVVAGILATTVATAPAPPPVLATTPVALIGTVAFGLLTGAAMGLDFPGSRRRFSRLAT